MYYVDNNIWHRKNKSGLEQLGAKKFNNENEGIIFHPTLDLTFVDKYDKVIFGPHLLVSDLIPLLHDYKGKTIYFNTLSPWVKQLYETFIINDNVKFVTIPLPVDVDMFRPSAKKKKFFIYYKRRHSSILHKIVSMVNQLKGYEFFIFNYGSYNEQQYREYISECEFGIWVGCHESQGFALEEALSCGCPLFVCDVNSVLDECFNDNNWFWYHHGLDIDKLRNVKSTSAPYFDETCGMIVNVEELNDIVSLHNKFEDFLKNIYNPREYISKELSIENVKRLIESIF